MFYSGTDFFSFSFKIIVCQIGVDHQIDKLANGILKSQSLHDLQILRKCIRNQVLSNQMRTRV